MVNRKKSILIVDDDNDLREVLKDIFLIKGYRVEAKSNGLDAIEVVKREHFDIALIDLIMEGINGVETLEKIQQLNQDISCFIMTAYPSDDNIKKVNFSGALQIFKKPFDIDRVDEIFEEEIAKKSKEQG